MPRRTRPAKSGGGSLRASVFLSSCSNQSIFLFLGPFYCYTTAREFFAQQGQRAPQMTLDGGDGHIQNFGDVGGIEVFLISEDHDHARRFGKRGDQAV